MRQRICAITLVAIVTACADAVGPVAAHPVHSVLMTVTVPGACLNGGCDPFSGDATTLALASVVNTGSSTAYLATCGQGLAVAEEQFVSGKWVWVGPAVSCAFPSNPVALLPGDSTRFNWWFAAGRRRLGVTVASAVDMHDADLDTSASFDIK